MREGEADVQVCARCPPRRCHALVHRGYPLAMGQERDWGRGADLELDWRGRTPPAKRGSEESAAVEHPPMASTVGHGMPGDPQHMSPELRGAMQPLLEGPAIRVRQLVEMSKVLVGWDA